MPKEQNTLIQWSDQTCQVRFNNLLGTTYVKENMDVFNGWTYMLVAPESRKNKSAVRCGAFNGATEAQTGLAHPPNTPAARGSIIHSWQAWYSWC